MPASDLLLIIVFALFGLEVLARFGSWCFAQWRDWQEVRESLLEDDEPAPKA